MSLNINIYHILQFSFCYETWILKKLQYVQYANINIFSTIFLINKVEVLDKNLDNNWKKNNAAFKNIRYEHNCQLRSDENES